MIDGAYADSVVRGNHVNVQGWEGGNPAAGGGLAACQLAGAAPCATPPGSATNPPTIKDWYIQDYGIYQEHTEDKRIGGRFVLQAMPVDGLLLTLDDNYAKETLVQNQYGFSAWFNNGSLSNVTLAPDSTVTNFVQPGTPTDFQAQINQSVIQSNTVGFNVKWDASPHTSYQFDAYTAIAKLNPGGQASLDSDVGYGNGPNGTSLGIVVPGGKNLPYPVGYGPGGDAANFINTRVHRFARGGRKLQPEQRLAQPVQAGGQLARRRAEVQIRRAVHARPRSAALIYGPALYLADVCGLRAGSGRFRRRRTDTCELDIQQFRHRLEFHQRLG